MRYAGHTSGRRRTREAAQEGIAEVFYRWRLNEHLELSPDLQIIQRPGGDAAGKTVRVFGVRASAGF
jgi:carbohydrate-selective porin OprB